MQVTCDSAKTQASSVRLWGSSTSKVVLFQYSDIRVIHVIFRAECRRKLGKCKGDKKRPDKLEQL